MAETQPLEEVDADLLRATPEPEARPAAAPPAAAAMIAELCLTEDIDLAAGSCDLASLPVSCPVGQKDILVCVGRLTLAQVSEVAREKIPAWLQRLLNDHPPASLQHLRLRDSMRNDGQQPAPRLAAIIWFQRRDDTAQWDCSIRACETDDNKLNRTHLMEDGEGSSKRIPHDEWKRIPNGSILHFVTRANAPEGGEPKGYDVFRFRLTLRSPIVRLQRPAACTMHLLKLVMPDGFMRRVIKALPVCRETTSCDITPSEFGDYHPMATQRQGRIIQVEGPSAAALLAGVMAVIDAAMQVEPATDNKQARPGLCLQKDGITVSMPNRKCAVLLGQGGREQRRLVIDCNLAELNFGPEAPGEYGERLLQAQAQEGRDDIQLLVSHVSSVLGPSPSGYSSRVQQRPRADDAKPNKKRARAEDASGGTGGGNGHSVLQSRKKKRKDQNTVNKQKHTASKKERHDKRVARAAKAKAGKKRLQEIKRRLDDDPDLMRHFDNGNGNGGSSSGGGHGTARSNPSSRGGGRRQRGRAQQHRRGKGRGGGGSGGGGGGGGHGGGSNNSSNGGRGG
jgi:hypothetical protein